MASKILITDDEEGPIEVLGLCWKINFPLSFILYASNGEEAFKILKENKDMQQIISDDKMPVMDGAQFLIKVMENSDYTKTMFHSILILQRL